MMSMILVLAQAAPTTVAQSTSGSESTDPIALLLRYGIPGMVIAALLTGLLWAKPAVDSLIKRAERAESQRDDLLNVYEEKIIPRLASSDEILTSMKPVLLDVVRVLENVRDDRDRPAPRRRTTTSGR
jgi:hypothetical protein